MKLWWSETWNVRCFESDAKTTPDVVEAAVGWKSECGEGQIDQFALEKVYCH